MPLRARHGLSLVTAILSFGCAPKPSEPGRVVAAAPDASVPPSTPTQVGECPLGIAPGKAFGPIAIGQDDASLVRSGLPVKPVSQHGPTAFFEVGPLHVRSCGGKVDDVWIDDLRKAPPCVTLNGAPVDPNIARERFIALFSGCRELPPRHGGTFTECAGGGVHVGYGMGDFLQVRVSRVGVDFDDACEDTLDDGKEVALPDADRTILLQRTLDLDVLAPFYHPRNAGRSPLTVVSNAAVAGKPRLRMFGEDAVYVAPAVAESRKAAVFEFTRVTPTARTVTIAFRYRIEGVSGEVVFRREGKDAREFAIKSRKLAER